MVPHEYVNALDALPSFVDMTQVGWVCKSAELHTLMATRFPNASQSRHLVWMEPQEGERPPFACEKLVVIAALPLMRLIPERRGWRDAPVGAWRLRRLLRRHGWRISAEYRFHTCTSILLNMLAQQLEQKGQPARADRWQFAGRLRYVSQFPIPSTLALMVCDPQTVFKA
ncbi:MAG: hypothetical protein ACPG8W_00985 [Candidatus Promineifilaceae bacterium]